VDAGYPHFPATRHPFGDSFSDTGVNQTKLPAGGRLSSSHAGTGKLAARGRKAREKRGRSGAAGPFGRGRKPFTPSRKHSRKSSGHRRNQRGAYGRHLGLAVPGLARRVLSGAAAAAAVAGVLRGAVRDGGEQRDVLPAPLEGHLRPVAGTGSAGLRDDGEGEPLPHPCPAAARSGGAGPQAAGRGGRPGRPARARAAAASAGPARRAAAARRVPGPVPRGDTGGGGAEARLVVDRRGARPARRAERGPGLGGPAGRRDRPGMAHGRLGVPAVPRGGRRAAERCAASWPDEADVYVYFNNDQRGAAPFDAAAISAADRGIGRNPTRAWPARGDREASAERTREDDAERTGQTTARSVSKGS
jgi:hypothetical protein